MVQCEQWPLGIGKDVLESSEKGVGNVGRLDSSEVVCPIVEVNCRGLFADFNIDTDGISADDVNKSQSRPSC